jgi:CRP/FNR family transcriptional regulator
MANAAILERAPSARVPLLKSARPSGPIGHVATPCSTCALCAICMPCGMRQQDLGSVDEVIHSRRRVYRGEHVYRAGEPLNSLYAFRSRFFKSYVDTPDGQTQVIGFPMAGEVVGMDGIDDDRHRLNVVTLDDGEVCVIPYAHFEAVAMRVPALQRQLHKVMSREIVRGTATDDPARWHACGVACRRPSARAFIEIRGAWIFGDTVSPADDA